MYRDDRCVLCGEYVPEGRIVCTNCERTADIYDGCGLIEDSIIRPYYKEGRKIGLCSSAIKPK